MTVDQQRQAFVAQLLGMTGNTKRTKLWDEFGYPRRIDFNQFYKAYKRFALGNAAVERIIEKCWEDYPTIIEGAESEEATTETSWEKEVKTFLTKNWQSIIEVDRRNLVGKYSALILQVADGKQWHEPIEDGSLTNLGVRGLVKFIPAWESQLLPETYQEDVTKPDYGEPITYSFRESGFGKSRGRTVTIHKSRVIILNEGGEKNQPETGISLLESGFNKLLDIEKTSGGAAEGFLKNASRQLGISLTKEVNLQTLEQSAKAQGYNSLSEAMNAKIEKLNCGTDSALVTQEGQAQILSVSPADPKPSWEVSVNEFASSIRIPFTILVGQQTGRLASDEDKSAYAQRCQARRRTVLTAYLQDIVERLIYCGIFTPPTKQGFSVVWSDLLAPGQKEKIANAKELANVAQTTQQAFGRSAILPDEIRTELGLEALPDGLPPVEEVIDENQDEQV